MNSGYAVWEGDELQSLREVVKAKRKFVIGLLEKRRLFESNGFPEEYLVTKRVLGVLWKRDQPDWEKIEKEFHTEYTRSWHATTTRSLYLSWRGENLSSLWGLLCNPTPEKVLLNPELSKLANELLTESRNEY